MSEKEFISIGDVMRATGEPRYIVEYCVEKSGPKSAGRAGNSRIWLAEDLPALTRVVVHRNRKRGRLVAK